MRSGSSRAWPIQHRAACTSASGRSRFRYDAEVAGGALFVGAAETVARRVATAMELLGATRFDFVAASSRMPPPDMLESIERFGREVVPRVRGLLATSLPPRL